MTPEFVPQNPPPSPDATGGFYASGEERTVEQEPMPEQEDHDHSIPEPRVRDLPRRLDYLPRFLLLVLIRLYQATFSRTLPPDSCRFYPTCSHYGYQAIYKYGALKGSLMAAWRILRCNPFNKGGYDPVP